MLVRHLYLSGKYKTSMYVNVYINTTMHVSLYIYACILCMYVLYVSFNTYSMQAYNVYIYICIV